MRARVAVAVSVLAAIGALLAIPAGTTARTTRRAGPKQFINAAILVHNAFANFVNDEFVGPYSHFAAELEMCHNVESSSGEVRQTGEEELHEAAPENRKLAENLNRFNRKNPPSWVRTFRRLGRRLKRAKRRRLAAALHRISTAHALHAHEFYDVGGVWVQIESVNCAAAEHLKEEAESIGTRAWTREFRGLVEVRNLFRVRTSRIDYPVGPYVKESP